MGYVGVRERLVVQWGTGDRQPSEVGCVGVGVGVGGVGGQVVVVWFLEKTKDVSNRHH